jgi:DNA polymerase III sliding clamp (beta) subunit (PCNA family)
MDITITDPAALKDAAGWAAAGVAHKPLYAWQSAIGLRWDGSRLTVAAFDSEVYATSSVPAQRTAEITDPDALDEVVYVFGPTLVKIAAQLPREPVRIRTSDAGRTVTVKCGPAQWQIRSIPDDGTIPEFPAIPDVAGTTPAAMLQVALRAVLPSVATDTKVPESLHHVNLAITRPGPDAPAKLTAWGTNRYMCGMMPCPWIPAEGVAEASVLVPRRVAEVIARDAAGEVAIRVSGSLVGFEFEGRVLIARLFDEAFPNMTRHMEVPAAVVIEWDAAELIGTLKRVGVATAGEDFPRVALHITGDLAEVTAGTEDRAVETVVIKARRPGEDGQDGPPPEPVEVDLAFNAGFLAAAVAAVPAAQVVALRYMSSAKAVGITDSDESQLYRGVLMPFSKAA